MTRQPEGAESRVKWSDYSDPLAGTVTQAVERSPHRDAFHAAVAAFTARINRRERVEILWWYPPQVYITVVDDRRDYPRSVRALASFDLEQGVWPDYCYGNLAVFARRGWRTFLQELTRGHVPLYSE